MKSSLKNDPASFWKYVNTKKPTENRPESMRFDGITTNNEKEQADLFARFFSQNYTLPIQDPHIIDHSPNDDDIFLDDAFILNELIKINIKKGAGPDGIHLIILRKCAKALLLPLKIIFNDSLANGSFPDTWKRSSVTPIFKKGARSNIENYRCIAKLPTIAKFFEHLVNIKLIQLVQGEISQLQHGFMKGRSTTSNLMEFTHYAYDGLNSGAQIDVLYTDFSKAFDRVDHGTLIRKLRGFNIPTKMIIWLQSYLSNRTQYVRFGGSDSIDFKATSGVPKEAIWVLLSSFSL